MADNDVLMVALTSVVRRPPSTQTIAGKRVEVRLVVAAAAGTVVVLPAAIVVGMTVAWNVGLLIGAAGAATAVGLVRWQPDGVPVWTYLAGAVRTRRRRVTIDGVRCQLYIGLAPAPDRCVGQTFTYARSAVEVDPQLTDRRGAIRSRR